MSGEGFFKRLGSFFQGKPFTEHKTDQPAQRESPVSPSRTSFRVDKIQACLKGPSIDMSALRQVMWSGCPAGLRARAWSIALGYLPSQSARHDEILSKKRSEYRSIVVTESSTSSPQSDILRQIRLDLPRTYTDIPYFFTPEGASMMERILLTWSVRNPASSYVQGVNDILVPIIATLFEEHEGAEMTDQLILDAEADAYWLLSKLLGDIQDHYIFGQPGIQRMTLKLKDLLRKTDDELSAHFEAEGLDLLQVTFRWLNCLLVRELPLKCLQLTWDACIAESDGFNVFLVYVCNVLLCHWRDQLKKYDFQEMMLFMRKLPTDDWTTVQIETLMAEAFVLKSLFEASPAHLQTS